MELRVNRSKSSNNSASHERNMDAHDNGNSEENKLMKKNMSNRGSVDKFVKENDFSKELGIYGKHKPSPLDMTYELEFKLEDLLISLQKERDVAAKSKDEKYEYREMLIEKIETLLNKEESHEKIVEQNNLELFKQNVEAENATSKERAEKLRELRACFQIAGKITAGKASKQEVKFLMEKWPAMYTKAKSQQIPIKNDKENTTTLKIVRENIKKMTTAEEYYEVIDNMLL